jgi:hypothetical protein
LGKEWRVIHEQHYTSIRYNYSGRRWLTALIIKLWQVAWNLWEHRNGIKHEHDSNQQIQEKNELNELLILQCWEGILHSTSMTEFLSEFELEKVRRGTVNYKIAWIRSVRSSENFFRRQQENDQSLRGMRECMRRFVAPIIR